jgi:TP53 regulating kinase-like protein
MDEMKPPVLLKKGAEANLYLGEWYGRKVVFKKRLPKEYRHPLLDEQIRTYRTIHEPQLMHEAKKAGVPTPAIFRVEPKKATITMQYIRGKQVKQILMESSKDSRQKLCFSIGESVGKLHEHGIIHGDLTTSNFIQDQNGKVFFVDFGLGEKTRELEARGVDLHLMKRALQSTHFDIADECFACAVEAYTSIMETETAENVLEKIREIERRGRYIAERKERNFATISQKETMKK